MPRATVVDIQARQATIARLQEQEATLEARVAELVVDLRTLVTAIETIRRRYPGVERDWEHWAAMEARRTP